MTELLVVMAVIGTLATIAAVNYIGYLNSTKKRLVNDQIVSVEKIIDTERQNVLNGINTGLADPVSGDAITPTSTCGAFLDAMKPRLAHLKNIYDMSPAITYSTVHETFHKAGKTRVTCYKLYHHGTSNGRACPMEVAAIRVTNFRTTCGAYCRSPDCKHSPRRCNGLYPWMWWAGMQKETFLGTLTTARTGGPPGQDGPYTQAAHDACGPGWRSEAIPLEHDY